MTIKKNLTDKTENSNKRKQEKKPCTKIKIQMNKYAVINKLNLVDSNIVKREEQK